MNEIRVKRMLLGGLAMFVVFIAAEILIEHVIGKMLFGDLIQELWLETVAPSALSPLNQALNLFIAVLNSTVLIWLYASLRPMYGVGTKTALITSALGITWAASMIVNLINLGLLPAQLGLMEMVFEAVELPIAMIAGAGVYEGVRKEAE